MHALDKATKALASAAASNSWVAGVNTDRVHCFRRHGRFAGQHQLCLSTAPRLVKCWWPRIRPSELSLLRFTSSARSWRGPAHPACCQRRTSAWRFGRQLRLGRVAHHAPLRRRVEYATLIDHVWGRVRQPPGRLVPGHRRRHRQPNQLDGHCASARNQIRYGGLRISRTSAHTAQIANVPGDPCSWSACSLSLALTPCPVNVCTWCCRL
jgi:hypothetical protein